MAAPASDWLKHFRLLLWTEFNKTWQDVISQWPLRSLCFSGRSEKQDGRSGLWLTETFKTSLWTAERNSTTLDRKQDLNVLYQVCVFVPIRKIWWPPRPLIRRDIFDFSETAEWNSTKLDGKQDVHVLYQICVFGPIGKANGRPGVWLADTFSISPLITLNGIQRNVTKSKISTSSTKSVFFGPISKQKRPPWLIREKGGALYSGARILVLI